MWRVQDISFEIDDEMTSDTIVTILIATPDGTLRFIAAPEVLGSTLVLHDAHIQGGAANRVGQANLRTVARALMEGMGIDGLVIEGALRTTGARPGRRPRPLRFTRRVRPSPSEREV